MTSRNSTRWRGELIRPVGVHEIDLPITVGGAFEADEISGFNSSYRALRSNKREHRQNAENNQNYRHDVQYR